MCGPNSSHPLAMPLMKINESWVVAPKNDFFGWFSLYIVILLASLCFLRTLHLGQRLVEKQPQVNPLEEETQNVRLTENGVNSEIHARRFMFSISLASMVIPCHTLSLLRGLACFPLKALKLSYRAALHEYQ